MTGPTPLAEPKVAPGAEHAWYESWFNEDYLKVYAHRNGEDACRQFDLLVRTIPLLPGHRILDLCCGNGRYLELFRKAGLNVTGQDLSEALLSEAAASYPGIPLVRRDMRHIEGPFDLITSFFTSFGYFNDDGNYEVLAAVARALNPGGHFWIDLPRAEHVRAHFTPVTQRRAGDGTLVREERMQQGNRIVKTIHLLRDGHPPKTYSESVRIYEPAELEAWLVPLGFRLEHRFGDYLGGPPLADAPRFIVHGVLAG